jgi:XRE family transcriptional regulator of biofilm formation
MSKQSAALDKNKAKRLGKVIRRIRTEQGIPATKLAEQTGVSRSYLSYLETGRFAEIGLDKFARIARVLDVSPDEMLRESGYLPPREKETPDPIKLLREGFGLTLPQATTTAAFVEFLKEQMTGRKPQRRSA